jgi:hypothetical protein
MLSRPGLGGGKLPQHRHHDHRLETSTDVSVRRLRVASGDGRAVLAWDYPGSTLLEVRVLRSPSRFATGAEDCVGQSLVYEGVSGSCRDRALSNGIDYRYTIFARHPGHEWMLWERIVLRPGVPGRVFRKEGRRPSTSRRRPLLGRLPRWTVALAAAALAAAALAALPPATAFASMSAPLESNDPVAEQATAIALGDQRVVDALHGAEYESTVHGSTDAKPELGDVVVVHFSWPAPRTVFGDWPIIETRAERRETVEHRLRVVDLDALDVLVDTGTERVLQIAPSRESTGSMISQDTTEPWSWLPWLVDAPWLPLPLIAAVATWLAVRAYVRSRAWRRRLPSMARHDRQALARLALVLGLLGGLSFQLWVVYREVRLELPYGQGLDGGSLQVVPILLFPAALYLAAVVLELMAAPHRGGWALVAVLAAVAYVYSIFAMMRLTTDDVSLLLSLMLAALVLVAMPRAFGAGRMGWSRSANFSRS